MLQEKDITITLKSQAFECKTYMRNIDETESVLIFESKQKTEDVHCPYCGGKVNICDMTNKHLRDMPIWSGMTQDISFVCHRYRCVECRKKHTEGIPFQHPGSRITERAAKWIQTLLLNKISIRSIQKISGIHWETIRNIHIATMEETLEKHTAELKASGYSPKYLAVDEFAIHKGHTYATCVMDLETGEVLWVGKGRSKEEFRRFFEETDPAFMADVRAVAMDMNASYHILVKEYLPNAKIVYDRYHMQAQYGKEVLGVVRLEEARKHKAQSAQMSEQLTKSSVEERKTMRTEIRKEKQQYSAMKKLRWTLLINGEKLSDAQNEHLKSILEAHSSLAVCYAMKEELIELFRIRNTDEAAAGWHRWFNAAKASGIPALVHFAELKEKRIDGLIAHAIYPISTGKLEGFNNKIKVAKRVGYGFRDDHYFFLLVRSLSYPNFP